MKSMVSEWAYPECKVQHIIFFVSGLLKLFVEARLDNYMTSGACDRAFASTFKIDIVFVRDVEYRSACRSI